MIALSFFVTCLLLIIKLFMFKQVFGLFQLGASQGWLITLTEVI